LLDETFKEADYALSRLRHGRDGDMHMQSLVICLQEITNVLRMTGWYGASFIVDEVRRLALAAQDHKVNPYEGVYAVLESALVEVHRYVRHVLSTGEDIPVLLLKLLNKMRALYGQRLLPESLASVRHVPRSKEGPELDKPDDVSTGKDVLSIDAIRPPRNWKALSLEIIERDFIQLIRIISRLHHADPSPADAAAACEYASKIADTLSLLGCNGALYTLRQLAALLENLAAGEAVFDSKFEGYIDSAISKVVQALSNAGLDIDVNHINKESGVMMEKKQHDGTKDEGLLAGINEAMSDPALNKYMEPVIKEALIELTLIRSDFESLIDHLEQDKIKEIQSHLRLITGAMVMLSLGRAANTLYSCSQYISGLSSAGEAENLNAACMQLFLDITDDMSRYLSGLSKEAGHQETLLNAMEDKSTRLNQSTSVNMIKEVVPVNEAFQPETQAGHDNTVNSTSRPMEETVAESLQDREKLNIELKKDFLQTAGKNIKAGGMVLEMLGKSPESTVLVKEFRKLLHALKTGALAAGISEVVELCHSMELLVTMLIHREDQHTGEIHDLLTQSYRQLTKIVEQYNYHENMTPVEELVLRINKRLMSPLKGPGKHGRPAGSHLKRIDSGHAVRDRIRKNHTALLKKNGRRLSGDLHKSQPGQFGVYVAELSDIQRNIEESFATLHSRMSQMKYGIDQLRGCLRQDKASVFSGGDKLHDNNDDSDNNAALSGYLNESGKLYSQGMQLMDSVGQCLMQQQQILASLKAGLSQTRIITVASRIAQFEKAVDQMGRESAKKVELNVVGGHLKLERVLLNKLIEPLKFLIGHSIEHWIEKPDHRLSSGKPETAVITLEFTKENSDLAVKIHDDGAGADIDEVRNAALSLGYIDSKDQLTGAEVAEIVFDPRFDQESNLSWLKTHDIPLADIATMIKSMGGSIVYTTAGNTGNTFIIHLPCELNISQVLMAQVAEEIYAIPAANIEDVVYLQRHEIDALKSGDDHQYRYNGHDYQFRSLGAVLGIIQPAQPERDFQYPIVLMSMGNKYIALQVNQIKGQREIILNQPVPELSRVKVISGATLLSDGRLVLVLELGALLGEDVGKLKAIKQLSVE